MMTLLLSLIFIFSLYLLPGLALSRFFRGTLRNNFWFILFLSYLVWPFYYLFLASINRLNGLNWLVLSLGVLLVAVGVGLKLENKLPDTDRIFPRLEIEKRHSSVWFKRGIYLLVTLFFLLVLAGKIGLPLGKIPVGDDRPRLQKATAIALSPKLPLFYNFPISEMTIYYFNNIPSGLLTKFTQNQVRVEVSWFIHNLLTTITMLWLITLLANSLFKTYFERLVLIFSLTVGSGLEFYLAKWKGIKENHLEWWTDWLGLSPALHTQISAFFTLFFWVSQHLFAGLLVIPLYFLLISTERKKLLTRLFIGLLFANLVGYSAFVLINIVIIYALFLLLRFFQKKEKFLPLVKENLIIGLFSLSLASPMILLYAGAQKENYFVVFSNVFWFFNNNQPLLKLLNFALTIPLYLLVEFGFLFLTFVAGFYLVIKKKLFQTDYLFWILLLYLPIGVIFIVKALDDNNISMRSLIPTQIALAVISTWVLGLLVRSGQRVIKTKLLLTVIIGLLLLGSLPTTLYESYFRVSQSFNTPDPIYKEIDKKLPLNSIVFEDSKETTDFVSVLGHRFTFKPLTEFSVTDYEYVAVGKTYPYQFEKGELYYWLKIIDTYPELKTKYHLYRLDDRDRYLGVYPIILTSDKLVLSKLDVPK